MVGLEAHFVWDKFTMSYLDYANSSANAEVMGFKYDAAENAYKTTAIGDDARPLRLAAQYKF